MFDILKRWFLSDRIRVSPRDGKMLTYQIGDRLIILGQLWLISDRNVAFVDLGNGVIGNGKHNTLSYILTGETGESAVLRTFFADGEQHFDVAEFQSLDNSTELFCDDIFVLARLTTLSDRFDSIKRQNDGTD